MEGVTDVFFSYSDTSYDYLMHRASIVESRGATFHLLGPCRHDDQGEQARHSRRRGEDGRRQEHA